jgi:hypothetical protein
VNWRTPAERLRSHLLEVHHLERAAIPAEEAWKVAHAPVLFGNHSTGNVTRLGSATPPVTPGGLLRQVPNAEQPPVCLQAGAVRKERVGTSR